MAGDNCQVESLEWRRDAFVVSTDRNRLDIDAIHAFLTKTYWAQGRTREMVARTVERSLCFGLYDGPEQIGFARVATDFSIFAHLMDVYVLDPYRGKGLGAFLVESALSHPELGTVKWLLATTSAHSLYEKFGFTALERPERIMERQPIASKGTL